MTGSGLQSRKVGNHKTVEDHSTSQEPIAQAIAVGVDWHVERRNQLVGR